MRVFSPLKHTGARTSLIVDPSSGRIPPLTPEAQKAAAADREFRLALLQATETCKTNSVACRGGKYDSKPSPRRADLPPRYNAARMNRHDSPEDGALADRCLTGGLPEFGTAFGGSFRRIVQSPSGISMFYDVGQGQGWQRNIVMNGSPHLPAGIRQWFGDSRGHWEGNTLVIDVTNFSPKTDYRGARENLHLVERWTRTGPTTLEYAVTIEDPTVWTRPWTVKQTFTKQSDRENKTYYEPRCVEGNYASSGAVAGSAHGRPRICGGARSPDRGQQQKDGTPRILSALKDESICSEAFAVRWIENGRPSCATGSLVQVDNRCDLPRPLSVPIISVSVTPGRRVRLRAKAAAANPRG